MELRYVESFDKTRIAYRFQKGKKPAILLIHGIGSNGSIWVDYFKAFPDHTIIAPDHRSHGRSQTGRTSIPNITKDIALIIKKEKLSNIVVVGSCLGAVIGAELQKGFPKKFDGLVLLSFLHKGSVRSRFALNFFRLLYKLLFFPFMFHTRKRYIHWPKYNSKPYLFPFLDLINSPYKTYFSLIKEILNHPIDIRSITVPSYILQGKSDPLVCPRAGRRSAKINPVIRYREVNTRHHISTNTPDVVIDLIKKEW